MELGTILLSPRLSAMTLFPSELVGDVRRYQANPRTSYQGLVSCSAASGAPNEVRLVRVARKFAWIIREVRGSGSKDGATHLTQERDGMTSSYVGKSG